jgi:SAM-dependent MidA family methyltransferase
VTPLEVLLREEIEKNGPISFRRFMEAALYHPDYGYYRRREDPFGVGGDFFTAQQLQPVFGILIAQRIRQLFTGMGEPEDFTVVELGAGRGEMSRVFSEFHYVPVDIERGALPQKFTGVVFSNEFFDALPVHRVLMRGGRYLEAQVGWCNGRFVWQEGDPVDEDVTEYIRKYVAFSESPFEDRTSLEVNLQALRWMERIAGALTSGYVLTVDYGYTKEESVRFSTGTLLSYRRHRSDEDVLATPGTKDITAHVNFTALQEHGAAHGLETVIFETLAQTLLKAGEADQFGLALSAAPAEEMQRRLQLKTLLFGMGDTFRTLLQKKRAEK